MNPKLNGEWSVYEIKMVKSLITRDNTNINYANDMNKKHNEIVDNILARRRIR